MIEEREDLSNKMNLSELEDHKTKCLRAINMTIEKYEYLIKTITKTPQHLIGHFFSTKLCEFCKLYYKGKNPLPGLDRNHSCMGCFMADTDGQCGCLLHGSFLAVHDAYNEFYIYYRWSRYRKKTQKNDLIKKINKRIDALWKIYCILRNHRKEDFVPENWTPETFSDISKEW